MTARVDRKGPLILVISDDPDLLQLTGSFVEQHAYEIEAVAGSESAAIASRRLAPDLILLDIDTPARSGPDACRVIRRQSSAPLILLSPLGSEDDAIEAFAAGADDYMVKPFGARLLAARIGAVLRRARQASPPPQNLVHIGGLTVDFDQWSVTRGGNAIALTLTEFRILETLIRNRGRVLANRELAEEIWGATAQFDEHLLRVNISRLRKKVERNPATPEVIITRPRAGYLITRPD
jgi:DNA-binding response OmpR family regulator